MKADGNGPGERVDAINKRCKLGSDGGLPQRFMLESNGRKPLQLQATTIIAELAPPRHLKIVTPFIGSANDTSTHAGQWGRKHPSMAGAQMFAYR